VIFLLHQVFINIILSTRIGSDTINYSWGPTKWTM